MSDNTVRILLVDDELDALDLMEELLTNMKGVEVVGKASNKFEAISLLISNKPNVIFQDIQMLGESGLDLVDEYRTHHFKGEVVFVTAHTQYAIDAIKKNAFDYLLKPVDLDDLQSLILRLLSEIQLKKTANEGHVAKRLKVPTRSGYLLISLDEIAFCEADGNYTHITKSDGERLTTSVHLGKLVENLDINSFFRVSRSAIMNINFLVAVNKGKQECTLKTTGGDFTLHISGKRVGALEALI